ncbi:protein phosphatase 1 inhibitor domain-containing protein [Phthorimaea operculella]|nr:protein phosphatase 1 inhibitor domain-containing protein [Phthorimaea operculella]
MSLVDDNSSENYGGMFENGHWDWDEEKNELKFISYATDEDICEISQGPPTGAVQFRDDFDYHEQLRFKNRYQRKVKFGQREVVTLQDIKDVAIFTAPTNLMSEVLISMLHRPTTERFIRALILYCQYYLQIIQVMASRKKKLDKTVRTPNSDEIENEYRDNLCDLRLLVAKQYCTINIGSCDMKRYHHMGSDKRKTLSHRDARLCETFLRMCVEIVYIALGRVSYNIIETEVHRLFKTERFNTVARNNPTDFITNMTPEERNVFLGQCLRNDTKFKACSPMVNEVFCHRQKDYRLLSLADVKHDK